jgi:serine/threonine-protein kinase
LALLREAADYPSDTAPTSMWRPIVVAQRSEAELDAGDAAAALASARQALDFATRAWPADDFRRGFPLFALARAELAAETSADAEPLLREALRLRRPPFPDSHPRVLEVEVALVEALAAQGRHAEAQALRARIEPLLRKPPLPYSTVLLARLDQRRGPRDP